MKKSLKCSKMRKISLACKIWMSIVPAPWVRLGEWWCNDQLLESNIMNFLKSWSLTHYQPIQFGIAVVRNQLSVLASRIITHSYVKTCLVFFYPQKFAWLKFIWRTNLVEMMEGIVGDHYCTDGGVKWIVGSKMDEQDQHKYPLHKAVGGQKGQSNQ